MKDILSDRILEILRESPKTIDELASVLEVSKKTIYKRIKTLVDSRKIDKIPVYQSKKKGHPKIVFSVIELE